MARDNDDFNNLDDLVRKAKSGAQGARDELIDQLQSYVNLMAGRFQDENLKQKVGASDIVQLSMVEVVKGFDNFRGQTGAEMKAWVRKILANQVRRTRRDFRRDKRDVQRERHHNDSRDQAIVLQDVQPTPQTDALQREDRQRLLAAIEELPDDYAQAIRLRSLERRPFKEVAAIMNRSEDAVTKLWFRAVTRLQALMKGDNESVS